jgi:hypothetical protein
MNSKGANTMQDKNPTLLIDSNSRDALYNECYYRLIMGGFSTNEAIDYMAVRRHWLLQ